ncbi:uncharacterized protein LOC133824148 [Humulus lupulus]|uniref:uncharacterized protein LOC133824148 n=1 Tax=Humulus lupulus TaxID=3486 RepID=UPI002B4039C3|nr:uncharacterized protein LOC133824148 [Humulus lupulus]
MQREPSARIKKNHPSDLILGDIEESMVTRKKYVNLVQFEFVKQMTDEFEMSMVGELNYFLGLQVKHSEDGTFISQISSLSRAIMVKTRGSGSWSVKDFKAGSLTASPSLTKKKARKSTLSQPSLIDGSITTSKAVVILDLEAPKVSYGPPSSVTPLTSVPGSSKKVRASLSVISLIMMVIRPKPILTPLNPLMFLHLRKKRSKGWFHVSFSRKSPWYKGNNPLVSSPKASSPVGSTPRSKFRSKVKKIPPPCSSSEIDPSEALVPFDDDPLEDDPSIDDDVASEVKSVPSEDPPVSPKGKKAVKIPEIRTKSPVDPKASPGSTFKAHSLNFCFNDNEKNMKHYVHHDFICEKFFYFSAHRVFGVIKNIEDRGWLGSLTGFDGFVPWVVQEFYANLNDDLFDSKSFMFGQVYVRGHWYLFSAAEITKVLNLPPVVINVDVDFNKDKVLSELVGQNMVWEQHSVLKVTDLTHYYAVLHKFATNNWIPPPPPPTHTSTITFDTVFFLYKVGTGLQVDLATLIFDQITALGKAKKKGQYLVFPHLIYKLLDSQKSLRLEYEIVIPPTAGVDYKLKKESSLVKTTKGITLKAGDADSVITELVGVKATLESV